MLDRCQSKNQQLSGARLFISPGWASLSLSLRRMSPRSRQARVACRGEPPATTEPAAPDARERDVLAGRSTVHCTPSGNVLPNLETISGGTVMLSLGSCCRIQVSTGAIRRMPASEVLSQRAEGVTNITCCESIADDVAGKRSAAASPLSPAQQPPRLMRRWLPAAGLTRSGRAISARIHRLGLCLRCGIRNCVTARYTQKNLLDP